MSDEPLIEGLRVIEVGDLGEIAGKLLADAGADVVRVEPPDGATSRHIGPYPGDKLGLETSLRFAYHNTSKRGVTLDLAQEEGRELWWRLVDGADIVIDAAGHRALDDLGVGWKARFERGTPSPRVWCSVTPFGREGPWASWESTDLIQLALGGPMMSTGYSDHDLPPIRGGFDHSFWIAGEYAVVGILGALIGVETGVVSGPELVDLSIHEAVSATTEGAFPNWEYRRELVQRKTGRHAAVFPTPEIQYPTADGRHMNVTGGGLPRDARNLEGLLVWMEEHDAIEDLRDPVYREVIFAPRTQMTGERMHFSEMVKRFISKLPADEAYRRGQGLHLPYGIVRRPEENLDDPHWQERGAVVELELAEGGTARVPTAPYQFDGISRELRSRAPLLGEHNHAIYVEELGLPAERLATLAEQGVI